MLKQALYIQRYSVLPDFTQVKLNSAGETFFVIHEPDYRDIIPANLLRRMSKIIRMGVYGGLNVLENKNPDEISGIITATGMGCLDDTGKFLQTMNENQEQLLNPTPFIQSTHNTIGGQIALMKKLQCYNYTYVHEGLSFESALTDAAILLTENPEKEVICGAFDEIPVNWQSVFIQEKWASKTNPWGEGAAFFRFSSESHHAATKVEILYSGTDISTCKSILRKRLELNLDNPGAMIVHNSDEMCSEFDESICFNLRNYSGQIQVFSALALAFSCQILENPNMRSEFGIKNSFDEIFILNNYRNESVSLLQLKRV